jgi:hypothetical protein
MLPVLTYMLYSEGVATLVAAILVGVGGVAGSNQHSIRMSVVLIKQYMLRTEHLNPLKTKNNFKREEIF